MQGFKDIGNIICRLICILWMSTKWYYYNFKERNKIDEIDKVKIKTEYEYPEFLVKRVYPQLPRAEKWSDIRPVQPVEYEDNIYIKQIRYVLKD